MKLDTAAKNKLIEGIDRVYSGYVALDCTESTKIFGDPKQSLSEVAHQMIASGETQKLFKVGNLNGAIKLMPMLDGTYSIHITPQQKSQIMTFDEIANPDNAEQLVALLANQSIEIDPKQPHPYINVDNHDGSSSIRIGGDKIPLYRTHLVTLHKIRERLVAGEDVSNLLVALATGSGKTFVQALWLACLHSAGMKGFFGAPGNLVDQFIGDLKRLLPESLVDEKIGRMGDKEGFLGQEKDQEKDIVVGNAFQALDDYYEQLSECDEQEFMLSFDEQHLLMRVERRRLRLIDLSERFLSCFLTATPNEETYDLCGKNPVATMSNKQKEQANQGKIPKTITLNAKSASDKNGNTVGFFARIQRWFNIFLSDSIQKQPTSAAVQVMDDLPFIMQDVDGRIQHSVRRKMLFLVDDPDSLINLCHRINEPQSREVYDNGNLYSREAIGQLLQIDDVDSALYDEEMLEIGLGLIGLDKNELASMDAEAQEKTIESAQNMAHKQQAMDQHLKANISHNFLDHILTDAMGMNLLELNKYRQENPEVYRLHALLNLGVITQDELTPFDKKLLSEHQIDYDEIKPADRSKEHYQRRLANKIDAQGADQISTILTGMAKNLRHQLSNNKYSPDQQNQYLINDPSEDKCMAFIVRDTGFDAYAKDHLVLCVMDDMRSKDLPIELDMQGKPRPFWGLKRNTYRLYDESGMKSGQAKPRSLKPIEALNPDAEENRFTPNYADITESQADQYFKLGFVGAYMSNRKTEGFSDLNLHTVVDVCNHGGQRLNGPDKLLQGLGRNRGLDETIEPLFVHSLGNGQTSAFALRNLDKEDYYKEYFQGMRSFREAYLKLLGDKLAQDIISEYHDRVEPDGSFDTERYRRKIMLMIREDLREINSLNNHEIKISRRQLSKVLKQAEKRLDEHVNNVENSNRLSGLVHFIGNVMTAIATVYTWSQQREPKRELQKAVGNSTKQADRVYHKMLSNTNIRQLIAKRFVSAEILVMFSKQRDIIQAIVLRNPKKYLKTELREQTETYEKEAIKPMLLKFISDGYYERAKKALDAHPDLLGFMNKNKNLFEPLQKDDIQEEEVKEIVIKLFQQMEDTKGIKGSDIIDAINLGKSYQEKFSKGLKEILDEKTQAQITQGISDDFIKGIKAKMMPLLMPEDQEKLENGLTHEVGQQFCKAMLEGHAKFLRGEDGGIDIEDQKAVFELFNTHLGENAVQNPEELIEAYQQGMSDLQKELEDSPVKAMNDDKFNELKGIYKEKIIPSMINLCPYDQRKTIQGKITDDTIEAFMKEHSETLQQMDDDGKPTEEIANFVLSEITGEKITSAQSPKVVEQQVTEGMQAVLNTKQTFSVANAANGVKALFWGVTKAVTRQKGFVEAVKGNYAKNIVIDDNFLKFFSTLIPLEQYLVLKEKIKADSIVADAVADKLVKLGDDARDPNKLVDGVAEAAGMKLDFVGDNAEAAKKEITAMLSQKDTNPSALLKQDVIESLSKPTKATLIPILAKYISDDTARSDFIEHCKAIPDDKLFDFIVQNEALLSGMNVDDFEGMKPSLLKLLNDLNDLDPKESKIAKIEEKHLRSLTDFVENQVTSLQDVTEVEIISEYLRSSQFLSVVQLAYNEQDLSKIAEVLKDDDKRSKLAARIKLFEGEMDNLDQLFSELVEVKQLDHRLEEAVTFIEDLASSEDAPLKNLDKETLNALIHDRLIKRLDHRLIKEQFAITLGTLNENELGELLFAMYDSNPPMIAKKLVEFNQLLQQGDTKAITEQFLSKTYDDFENLPLIHVFKVASDIHEEMMRVHCHFNEHDMQGKPSDTTKPKIYEKLSVAVQGITVKDTAEFANQISYLRGLQNAFPEANELHKANHADEVRHIKRIRDKVLDPIRIKIGRSAVENWFADKLNAIKSGLRSFGKLIASAFEAVFSRGAPTEPVIPDEHKQQRKEDKKEAIDFTDSIMKLAKLTKNDVKKDGPMEAVDTLLQSETPETVEDEPVTKTLAKRSLHEVVRGEREDSGPTLRPLR
ncbi:DEAD/DEAH box helicase family protein [uncultured Legionella sp.]|uniref:DEAD/DEAH box helicase family protein n=1 Tax=uncultured Legionella sp. TaxID=210934 RepID=UPI002605864D|nr:DEAD/DEAH box helicase family protein [uncultured Legionella sp.]